MWHIDVVRSIVWAPTRQRITGIRRSQPQGHSSASGGQHIVSGVFTHTTTNFCASHYAGQNCSCHALFHRRSRWFFAWPCVLRSDATIGASATPGSRTARPCDQSVYRDHRCMSSHVCSFQKTTMPQPVIPLKRHAHAPPFRAAITSSSVGFVFYRRNSRLNWSKSPLSMSHIHPVMNRPPRNLCRN